MPHVGCLVPRLKTATRSLIPDRRCLISVPGCDDREAAFKFRNESRTNRGRIADSMDFGLRSRDISSARSKLPQDEVARKPSAGFSPLKPLTPRPITPSWRSQVRSGANPGDKRLKRDGFSSNRHPVLGYCWSMMFSENPYPLFGIML